MMFPKKSPERHERRVNDPFDRMFGFRPPVSQHTQPVKKAPQTELLNKMTSEFKTPEGDWDMEKLFSTVEQTQKVAGQFKDVGSGVFSLFKKK